MSFYLGVDVSKATLDSACTNGKREESLSNHANKKRGWNALKKKAMAAAAAQGAPTIHLIIEPTGGYERGFVAYAHSLGWRVTVVNPFYVRRFIQGQGQRGKSDARDALMLASYGREKQPPAQWQMAEDTQELQGLVSRQDDLKKLLRAEGNRLKQAQQNPTTPVSVRRSIERTIKALEKEAKALDDKVKELLSRSEILGEQEVLLRTTPGVGQHVAPRLLALFYRFQALTAGQGTANQLVAFLGLDPQPYDSGSSVHKRPSISRMGDKAGRAGLYMGALGGVGGDNPLRLFYQRLLERGKAKKLALVACSRKILLWAWAIFNSGQPFDPQRALPNPQIAP